jgi:hypothetical protein
VVIDHGGQSVASALELTEAAHQVDQGAGLQEDQSTIHVVIGQRPELFVSQRDVRAQLPVRRRVKGGAGREAHDLVDPTETVDGHLFHEQLFRYTQYLGTLINDQRVWCHRSSSNESILSRRRRWSGLNRERLSA